MPFRRFLCRGFSVVEWDIAVYINITPNTPAPYFPALYCSSKLLHKTNLFQDFLSNLFYDFLSNLFDDFLSNLFDDF